MGDKMGIIIDKIKTFFVHCGTGSDNTTWDVVRVGGGLGILAAIGLAIGHMVLHNSYDPTSFGTGIAAIIASVGAGVGMKKGSEPGDKQ